MQNRGGISRKARKKMHARDFSKGYDVVGNIAVIDSQPRFAKKIAEGVMKTNRNVETVLRKGGAVSGKYRTRKHIYVSGKRNYVAEYKENGCVFRVDLRTCFFSTRLAFERQRIAGMVGPNETVLVMFAGVGPFAIEIAKKAKNSRVIGVELNRHAYEYMLENIRLNKAWNASGIMADVKEYAKTHRNSADRIIMPLPMSSDEFLESAYIAAKERCTLHYYSFGNHKDAFSKNLDFLRGFFSERGARIRVIQSRVVRSYSADTAEIVIDCIINKVRSTPPHKKKPI